MCIGDKVGQCVNGILQVTSACSPGTACQVLPLVNKPGTTISCDTESDKIARFQASGVLPPGNAQPAPATPPPVAAVAAAAPASPVAGNKAGEFVCIDDTKFKQFTSATEFTINSCPPGFCFTRSPPIKNPCVGIFTFMII